MSSKLKHKQRSRYSSHSKPDFRPFISNAASVTYYKTMRVAGTSFLDRVKRIVAPLAEKFIGERKENN